MLRASLLNLENVMEEKGGEKVLYQVESLSSFGNSKKPYVPLLQVIIILGHSYEWVNDFSANVFKSIKATVGQGEDHKNE